MTILDIEHESKYIIRFLTYYRYRLLLVGVLYFIFSVVNKTFSPFEYNFYTLIIFITYFIYQTLVSFYRTRYFLKKIEYDGDKFIISYQNINELKLAVIEKKDFHPTLSLYEPITRTVKYYMIFLTIDTRQLKQFDYYPWTDARMINLIEEINNIKKKANP